MGGHNAMLAVACCLRNRVAWYNGDWGRMLNAAPDLAPCCAPEHTEINMGSGEFRRVLQEIDDIFTGIFTDDFTSGGVYYLDALYADKGKAVRPWFRDKILGDPTNHRRVAQVGMLYIFS